MGSHFFSKLIHNSSMFIVFQTFEPFQAMGTWGPERHLQENARIRDNEASNSIGRVVIY